MPEPLWTIRDVLRWTQDRFTRAGLDTPRLDAEVLLAHALGCDRVTLYTDHHRPLSPQERSRYRTLVARRLERRPVAHLVGHREFWSRRFRITRDVLIPRPETETLVEVALAIARQMLAPRILDVGTGSGVLAITLAAELPEATVVATDVSEAALALARENARAHGVNLTLQGGDLLAALPAGIQPFHLVVANLPYIPPAERDRLQPEVLQEPEVALFADGNGLALIEALIGQCAAGPLRPGGWIALEVGAGQAEAVAELLRGAGYGLPEIRADLAGIPRVVAARWPETHTTEPCCPETSLAPPSESGNPLETR